MTRRSLTDRTVGGFLWTFFATGGQSLVNMVVVVVLARLLAPAEFGVVSAALVVVGFSQIFTHLGVGPAIVQMPGLTPHHVRVGFTLSLALGGAMAIVVALMAPAVAGFFRMPELVDVVRVLAVTFPIAGLANVGHALLQRAMAFRALAAIQLVSFTLGYGAVGILLASLGLGVWALVLGHVGQTGLKALLVLWLRRDAVGVAFSRAAATGLLSFGSGVSLARLANYTATQGDNLVVGRGLGADALGAYGRAYQLVMLPANLIGAVLDKVLFPAMASIQHDAARLGRAYLRAVAGVALVTLPASAVLAVTAPELVAVVLGPQWTGVVAPFQVLVVFLVFRTGYKVSDSLARATGAVFRWAWRQWVYAGAIVFGAWLGLTLGGTTGVALGVGLAVTVNFVLMLHLSLALTRVRWLEVGSILLRHLGIALVVAAAAAATKGWVTGHGWPALPVLVAVSLAGLAAWSALWVATPGWFGAERADLAALARRLRRGRLR